MTKYAHNNILLLHTTVFGIHNLYNKTKIEHNTNLKDV